MRRCAGSSVIMMSVLLSMLLVAAGCDSPGTPSQGDEAAEKVADGAKTAQPAPPAPPGDPAKPAIAPKMPPRPELPELQMRDRDRKIVIAEVDGRPIYAGTYDRMVALRTRMMRAGPAGQKDLPKEMLERVQQEALDRLIDEQLWVGVAKAEGISVTPEEAQQELEKYLARFREPEQRTKWMAEHKIDEVEMKDDFLRKLSADRARRKVVDEAKVSPEALKKFYDENPNWFDRVDASHILIKVAPNADETARKAAKDKLLAAKARLEKGEDFAKVAAEVSDCPSGKAKGGNLGVFNRGRMVPAFEKVAFELKPGALSDVVETQFGYHIIRVEKREADPKTFEQAEPLLRTQLSRKQQQEKFEAKEKAIREKAKIVVHKELL